MTQTIMLVKSMDMWLNLAQVPNSEKIHSIIKFLQYFSSCQGNKQSVLPAMITFVSV